MPSLVDQTLGAAPEPEERQRRRRSLVDQTLGPASPVESRPSPGLSLTPGEFPDPRTAFGDPNRAEPQPSSTAGEKARFFLREAPRGAAETVDFLLRAGRSAVGAGAAGPGPAMLVNTPFSEPALPPEAIEGARRFGERISGLPRTEKPETLGEQFFSLAGEETGAAAVTGPFMAARAAQKGRLALDLSLEAGSVGGAAAGRLMAPEDSEVGQIIGGVVGGLAGQAGMAATRGLANVPVNALDRRGVRVPGRRSERASAENLQTLVSDRNRALARLEEIEQLRAEGVPVPPLPLGAAVNDPALMRSEAMRARPGEQMLAFEEARRQGNVELRQAAIALGAPRNADVEAAREAARLHVRNEVAAFEEAEAVRAASFGEAEAAQRRAVEASMTAAGAGPDVRASAISTEARRELEVIEARVFAPFKDNAQGTGLYQDLARRADEAGARFAPSHTRQTAKAIVAEAGAEGADTIPADIIELAENLPESGVPFSRLRGLQARINRAKNAANISEERRAQSRVLERLGKAVQADIDAADDLGTAPAIAEELRAVNAQFSAASEEFRRKGTATGRIFRKSGAKVPEPSETLGLYFKPGAVERAREFKRVATRSPTLQSGMRRYIVQTAYEATANADGSVNADRLARWMNRHRSVLDEFPEAKALVANTQRLGQTASGMGFTATRTRPEIERSAVALFVDDPQRAVRRVLRNNDQAEAVRLLNLVKDDPEALAGLRRSFWDEVVTSRFREDVLAGTAGSAAGDVTLALNPAAIRRTLETSGGVVETLFGKGHVERLEKILTVQDAVARIPTGSRLGAGQGAAPTFLRELMGSGVVLSQILSPMRRIIKGAQLRSRFLEGLTDAQAQALLDEAVWDPALARTLLTKVVPQNVSLIEARLRSNLASLGFRMEGRAEREGGIQ